MGTDVTEITETLPSPHAIKVHHLMCTELITLVGRVSKIFPEIEDARPRCSSGIQVLCLLQSAIRKAMQLLQYCSESSKLYLALTGDVILSRCKKSRNLLEHSLSQIQNNVPVMLAAEISKLISDLRGATFNLDAHEEEAGKVLRALLQQYASANDSIEESAIEYIKFASVKLHITSQKALLIEKRSIRKLLDKVGAGEQAKKQILLFFFNLLKKYGKLIVREQTENARVQHEDSFSIASSCDQSIHMESRLTHITDEAQTDMLRSPVPPEEFKCPISFRLMYDPVVIASGQTFERFWIKKWFNEGHDTCPKTQRKLANLSVTPNTAMKDLISKWCMVHGISISDPYMLPASVQSWETSSTSIASLSSSIDDLCLPVDLSNISLGSLDTSHSTDSSRVRIADGISFISATTDDGAHRFQSGENTLETHMEIMFDLDVLPWESQCKVVEDVESNLKHDDQACNVMLSESSFKKLLRFLKEAYDKHDLKAQRSGCLLLLAFLKAGCNT
ncbi:unnamed protein product [Ilex paraguariensis]|uniref:U-box domain-containing protein n=1 Tax=Ilex paraguariensis TaxID=185542 RepID=A0ABC8S671_9AQUA